MNPQIAAREWLVFVGSFLFGLVVFPVCITAFTTERLAVFYEALVDPDRWWVAWGTALAPYVVVQLARSVMWAARIVRK